ncbi:uncharacterized protein [Macrobrachium rosenbergii]|uniref:uncharacterized protein n=1 Tax=Macrobrachium rosenbergii TaxID=79674 RepID=UPI0034D43DA9
MVSSAALSRDINYVEGPEGQVVVVVPPNQRRVGEMHIVIEHIGYTLCAISWGVVALPFTIIGFSLTCVGLSRMKSDPGHHVLTVGLVFFHIGLVTTALFCISMYCFKKEQKKKVAMFMHNPSRRSPAEDRQPMLPTSIEEARAELTPYQHFMLHRGTEVNSSGTSPPGVQTPFTVPVSNIPSVSSSFQEREFVF